MIRIMVVFYLFFFVRAYELIVECRLEVGVFNFVITTTSEINRLRRI